MLGSGNAWSPMRSHDFPFGTVVQRFTEIFYRLSLPVQEKTPPVRFWWNNDISGEKPKSPEGHRKPSEATRSSTDLTNSGFGEIWEDLPMKIQRATRTLRGMWRQNLLLSFLSTEFESSFFYILHQKRNLKNYANSFPHVPVFSTLNGKDINARKCIRRMRNSSAWSRAESPMEFEKWRMFVHLDWQI